MTPIEAIKYTPVKIEKIDFNELKQRAMRRHYSRNPDDVTKKIPKFRVHKIILSYARHTITPYGHMLKSLEVTGHNNVENILLLRERIIFELMRVYPQLIDAGLFCIEMQYKTQTKKGKK